MFVYHTASSHLFNQGFIQKNDLFISLKVRMQCKGWKSLISGTFTAELFFFFNPKVKEK